MFDFAITQKGDLVFTQSQIKRQPLNISFILSESNAKKLSFQIIDAQPEPEIKNGFKVSFVMEELPRNKRAVVLQDSSAKRQALKLRIATAVGQLKYRQDVGSTLESIRHKPIFDEETLSKTQDAVYNALKHIEEDIRVIAEPFINKEYGYNQGIKISIYEDGFLMFNHYLEG